MSTGHYRSILTDSESAVDLLATYQMIKPPLHTEIDTFQEVRKEIVRVALDQKKAVHIDVPEETQRQILGLGFNVHAVDEIRDNLTVLGNSYLEENESFAACLSDFEDKTGLFSTVFNCARTNRERLDSILYQFLGIDIQVAVVLFINECKKQSLSKYCPVDDYTAEIRNIFSKLHLLQRIRREIDELWIVVEPAPAGEKTGQIVSWDRAGRMPPAPMSKLAEFDARGADWLSSEIGSKTIKSIFDGIRVRARSGHCNLDIAMLHHEFGWRLICQQFDSDLADVCIPMVLHLIESQCFNFSVQVVINPKLKDFKFTRNGQNPKIFRMFLITVSWN